VLLQTQQQQQQQLSSATNQTPDKSKRATPKIRWSSKEHRETMRQAVEAVLVNGNTTKVAQRFNIPARTLRRYVAKEKKRREVGGKSLFDTMKNDSGTKSRNVNIPGSGRKKKAQTTKKPILGRERTASVDFVMKHIHGADPSSFSDMISKDIILSFGDAAHSGRLRNMSTDFGGRTRVTSGDRYIMEKLNSVDPIDLNDENKSNMMDIDFEMPTLVGNDGGDHGDATKFSRQRKAKRDRNISLDLLGLQFEPTAQKALLSTSPFGGATVLLQSPQNSGASMLTKNLGDLMRHRTSTANSITTFVEEDIDVTMVETPRAVAPSYGSIPDFGFAFEV